MPYGIYFKGTERRHSTRDSIEWRVASLSSIRIILRENTWLEHNSSPPLHLVDAFIYDSLCFAATTISFNHLHTEHIFQRSLNTCSQSSPWSLTFEFKNKLSFLPAEVKAVYLS